jgi:RecJ-like exonuclease
MLKRQLKKTALSFRLYRERLATQVLEKLRQGPDKNVLLETCPNCRGSGKFKDEGCLRCQGTGKIPSAKR